MATDYDIKERINASAPIYQWTLSGSGTGEYYLELLGGGDPLILLQPVEVCENGSSISEGTAGSLAASRS